MDKENNKNKKKIITYYLIIAVSILLITAITLTTIFVLKNNSTTAEIDNPITNIDTGDDNNADDSNTTIDNNTGENTADNNVVDDESNSTTVATQSKFVCPIATVDILNSYTFYKNNTLNCYHFHTGLDFSGEEGTDVYASLDGTVESITTGDILDGTVITLSHDNGVKTVYMFIDAKEGLSVGDTIKSGEKLGTIAKATGKEYKDGDHLHFEIYVNDSAVDPEDYLEVEIK